MGKASENTVITPPITAPVTVAADDPRSPAARALLEASHANLAALYPPEDVFALSIDDLLQPHIRFITARIGGVVAGCAALAIKSSSAKTGPDYGEVKSMWVDPNQRGKGIAAALMTGLDALARAENLSVMRLETGDDMAPAHALYRAHGFRVCGPFGDYKTGPHSVFMEKIL